MRLPARTVLSEPGRPVRTAYFPLSGLASIVTVLEDGSTIEGAVAGREGMIGLSVFLGSGPPLHQRTLQQVDGDALSIDAAEVRAEMDQSPALRDVLGQYAQAVLAQTAQSVACNRAHSVRARCARWLLVIQDRTGEEEFPLTHEFLSDLLGVRRPSVTAAAGRLQARGLITYHRGRVRVQDREGLEKAACECYRAVQEEFDRLHESTRAVGDGSHSRGG